MSTYRRNGFPEKSYVGDTEGYRCPAGTAFVKVSIGTKDIYPSDLHASKIPTQDQVDAKALEKKCNMSACLNAIKSFQQAVDNLRLSDNARKGIQNLTAFARKKNVHPAHRELQELTLSIVNCAVALEGSGQPSGNVLKRTHMKALEKSFKSYNQLLDKIRKIDDVRRDYDDAILDQPDAGQQTEIFDKQCAAIYELNRELNLLGFQQAHAQYTDICDAKVKLIEQSSAK